MDFAHPEKSDAGYDPLQYVKSDQDAVRLARDLVSVTSQAPDPYWDNSAASVLAAEILLVKLIEEHPTLADVIKLHRSMEVRPVKDLFVSSLDDRFYIAEEVFPWNQATRFWNTIKGPGMRLNWTSRILQVKSCRQIWNV